MKLTYVFAVIGCMLLSACGPGGRLIAPYLEVEIVNRASIGLDGAEAHFGDFRCRWGRVGKTFSAVYLFYPHPITPKAELHWDEEGKHRVEHLDLSEIYRPGRSGRLIFTVHDGRVEVSFIEKS